MCVIQLIEVSAGSDAWLQHTTLIGCHVVQRKNFKVPNGMCNCGTDRVSNVSVHKINIWIQLRRQLTILSTFGSSIFLIFLLLLFYYFTFTLMIHLSQFESIKMNSSNCFSTSWHEVIYSTVVAYSVTIISACLNCLGHCVSLQLW